MVVYGPQPMRDPELHSHFLSLAGPGLPWTWKMASTGPILQSPGECKHNQLLRLNQDQGPMDTLPPVEHSCGMKSKQGECASERSLVSVVDDDESVRESLPDLLNEFGYAVRAFSSAEAFLSSDCVDKTRCLILDVMMPGMTGLEIGRAHV